MGSPALDPEAVLEQLKAEHRTLRWEPLPPDDPRRTTTNGQSRSRHSLQYLHGHWVLPDAFEPGDAGGGFRGRIVGLFGRLTFRVLSRYLTEEREVIAHLVRVTDALEKRCDELALRCEELDEDAQRRQASEAANLTELALLLDRLPGPVPPTASGDPAPPA